jgi:hypothetical protein
MAALAGHGERAPKGPAASNDGVIVGEGRQHGRLRNAGAAARTMLAGMCRNIRPLFNFEPPATDEEIHAAALQYVRKVSGTRKPSEANSDPFERAIAEIAKATRRLVDSLETTAPPKNREVEAAKARERSANRFG